MLYAKMLDFVILSTIEFKKLLLQFLTFSLSPKYMSEEIALADPNFFTASSCGGGFDERELVLNAARDPRETLQ